MVHRETHLRSAVGTSTVMAYSATRGFGFGKGVQGGGWLPDNMQHHQPQVVPTSALEGCSATASRRLFQRERKREVCVKEREGGGKEGWREGRPRARARARARVM